MILRERLRPYLVGVFWVAILVCSSCIGIYPPASAPATPLAIEVATSPQLASPAVVGLDSLCPPIALEPGMPSGLLFSMRVEDQGYLCYLDEMGLRQCPIALADRDVVSAKWAPGKDYIAYMVLGPSKIFSLWIARPDGSGQVQVVEQAPYVEFVWLANQLRLDYTVWKGYDVPQYDPAQDQRFVMNAEDLTTTQVENPCREAYAVYADAGGAVPAEEFLARCRFHLIRWSPDKSLLAMRVSLAEGEDPLFQYILVRVPSRELIEIELPDPMASLGNWAPDSRRLGLAMDRNVFVLDSVTLNLQQLTQYSDASSGGASTPVWSPDGEWLAFTSDEGEQLCLYAVGKDGAAQRRLGCGLLSTDIVWAPDSRMVAYEFRDNIEGRVDVYAASLNGGPVLRMTKCGHRLELLDWR